MKWILTLKTGYKLMVGFSCMILLMTLIGFAGYRSIITIQQNLVNVFEIRLPSIANLEEADRDLHQLLVAERSMIFTNAKSDKFKDLVKDYEESFVNAD